MSNQHRAPSILIGPRVRKSPYFDATLRYGAEAFTVYNHVYMPTSYGDNVRDYWALVNDVTLWDVTCQRQIQVSGPDAFEFIQFLTPRDMSRCEVGQCQYMVLTDESGGIVNDAVMLRIEKNLFWLSPGDGDVLWWVKGVAVNSGLDVQVVEPDVSPLQLQGPKAPHVAYALFGDQGLDLPYYRLAEITLGDIPLLVSRTGWSGEHCYELYLRDSRYGDELWERVMAAGRPFNIAPIAPNTIRSIEGGLLSYNSDITLADNPFTIGLGRFVDFEKDSDFIGREALRRISEQGAERRLVGIEIDGGPIAGNDAMWAMSRNAAASGRVTRCCWSPRLERNIGWANVLAADSGIGTQLTLHDPAGDRAATVCKTPWFNSFTAIPEELKAEIRKS